jgi:hypothetical protein
MNPNADALMSCCPAPSGRSTKARIAASAALCAGLLLPSPAARADAGSEALCTFTTIIRQRPGYLLSTTTKGAVFTPGGAPVTCIGRVGGQVLSPEPGTLSVQGTYEGTCPSATAEGRLKIETRTVGGDPLILQGPIAVTRVGPVVRGGGQLDGVPFELTLTGTADPQHPEDNCVTKPLDHILGTGVITINGAEASVSAASAGGADPPAHRSR